MEPPKRAQDHLGRPQNAFADQNQGDTMVIRPLFEPDPRSGPGRPIPTHPQYAQALSGPQGFLPFVTLRHVSPHLPD
jgi:hypothetical protein